MREHRTKNHVKRLLVLVMSFAVSCILLGQNTFAAVTKQSIAVPVYQYPTIGTFWSDVVAAGGTNVPFAIANDANGHFSSADPNYTAQIASNTAAGIRSVGYVYSNYQARTFQDVYNDINNWHTYYPGISGILIDLVKVGTAADLCYISLLTEHIKSLYPNDLVVLNFGTNVSPSYEPYGDIFMNAENYYSNYTSWTPLYTGFEDNVAYQNRFWHSIHTTSSGANYTNALALARANNAGWVYITDDTMPNAYKATPGYWSTEQTDVASLPHSTIPNRGLAALPSGCQDLTLQDTNTTTTQTQKTTTASVLGVTNTSSLYAVDSGTRMSFSLPSGVQIASASGTNWTCSNSSCVLGTSIAASGSAPDVNASFAASCDYTSGSVRATLTNFAGNTWYKDISLTRPSDCATAAAVTTNTLADTGIQTGMTTGVAVLIAGAAVMIYRKRKAVIYRLTGWTRSS